MYKRFALWVSVAAVMVVLYNLPLRHKDFHSFDSLDFSYAEIDGVKIGYRTVGEGDPVVLIMGYGASMDFWNLQFIKSISAHHKIIIFDNRGIGSSSADFRSISISLLASDVYALIHSMGFSRASVLGWSMGAIVAEELAINYPEVVNKLILYGAAYENGPVINALNKMNDFDSDQFNKNVFPEKWLKNNPSVFDDFNYESNVDQKMLKRQYDAISKWNGNKSRLADIECPTLIICGEDDWVTPVNQSNIISELISGSWLVRYKNAGHWLMYQYPEGMASTVNNFLLTDQILN